MRRRKRRQRRTTPRMLIANEALNARVKVQHSFRKWPLYRRSLFPSCRRLPRAASLSGSKLRPRNLRCPDAVASVTMRQVMQGPKRTLIQRHSNPTVGGERPSCLRRPAKAAHRLSPSRPTQGPRARARLPSILCSSTRPSGSCQYAWHSSPCPSVSESWDDAEGARARDCAGIADASAYLCVAAWRRSYNLAAFCGHSDGHANRAVNASLAVEEEKASKGH